MNSMILAAGFGTRFRPHSETAAKPTFPFLNIPLLHYSFFWGEFFSVKKTIINTHHCPESIQRLVEKPPLSKRPVILSHENEILGNGGGLNPVKEILSEDDFLVSNADTVVVPNDLEGFKGFVKQHRTSKPLCTLMLMPHPQAGKAYGAVWIDSNGQVKGFGKSPPGGDESLQPLHFFGYRLFSPQIFEYIPEGNSDIFLDVLTSAIRAGEKIDSYVLEAPFFDGGNLTQFLTDSKTALSLFESSEFLKVMAQLYWPDFDQRSSWKVGTNFTGNQAHHQAPDRLFGQNVFIGDNCKLDDMVVLGNDVTVGHGCQIKNAVIADGIVIRENSIIENDLVLT